MLLDVVFTKFDDDCRNIEPVVEAYEWAQLLKNKMSIFYDKEHKCYELVLQNIGFPLISDTAGGTEGWTDGRIICNYRPVIILGLGGGIGIGGVELSFQLLEYYRHFIAFQGLWAFLDGPLPCFIITLTIAKIFFSGAVYTQLKLQTKRTTYDMLARYLTALGIAYHTLSTYSVL